MTDLPALTARNLDLPGLRHGFFTRNGGVSDGVYTSLNGGVGSDDDPGRVAENRARMATKLGVDASRLLVPFQFTPPTHCTCANHGRTTRVRAATGS